MAAGNERDAPRTHDDGPPEQGPRDDEHREPTPLTRRAFTRLAVVGSCGALAAAAGAGCGKPMTEQEIETTDGGTADPCELGDSFAVPEASQLQINQTLELVDRETIVTRDARGYFAMWSACRHAGCLIAFKPGTRTYDCPCHGSRYTISGEVINGPATEPLLHRDMCRLRGVLTVSKEKYLSGTTKRTL